jgi:hypothetical protein
MLDLDEYEERDGWAWDYRHHVNQTATGAAAIVDRRALIAEVKELRALLNPDRYLEPGARLLADLAYQATTDTTANKVAAAIWAYLWALRHQNSLHGLTVWPSLDQLRKALEER